MPTHPLSGWRYSARWWHPWDGDSADYSALGVFKVLRAIAGS